MMANIKNSLYEKQDDMYFDSSSFSHFLHNYQKLYKSYHGCKASLIIDFWLYLGLHPFLQQ